MGEGNAVSPYKTDPFSAQRPCGQQTQKEAASLPNPQDERTGAMRIF